MSQTNPSCINYHPKIKNEIFMKNWVYLEKRKRKEVAARCAMAEG
jgi:hypothetical protein